MSPQRLAFRHDSEHVWCGLLNLSHGQVTVNFPLNWWKHSCMRSHESWYWWKLHRLSNYCAAPGSIIPTNDWQMHFGPLVYFIRFMCCDAFDSGIISHVFLWLVFSVIVASSVNILRSILIMITASDAGLRLFTGAVLLWGYCCGDVSLQACYRQ